METITAIHTRHSISRVRPDPISREIIEQLLSAAVQAPNHYHNRPWHFVVLTGQARERMGEVMARSQQKRIPDSPQAVLDVERNRPLRAPLLVVVGIDPPPADNPKILEIENICAGAAAVENLLLAAHDLGLGAIWRTGGAVRDLDVKRFLEFSPEQTIIAIVYIGYPELGLPVFERPSYADRVSWLDE